MFEYSNVLSFSMGGTPQVFHRFLLFWGESESSNIQNKVFELSVGRYPGVWADFGLQEEGGSQMFELQGPNALNRENPWGPPHGKKNEHSNIRTWGLGLPARDTNI